MNRQRILKCPCGFEWTVPEPVPVIRDTAVHLNFQPLKEIRHQCIACGKPYYIYGGNDEFD